MAQIAFDFYKSFSFQTILALSDLLEAECFKFECEQVELETKRGTIDTVVRDVSSQLIRRAAAASHQENSSVL